MGGAHPPHALGRELEREPVALDDDVVVAERLPLLERERHGRRQSSAQPPAMRSATVARRVSAGAVDHLDARELAHPGQLAPHVGAVAALDPLARPRRGSASPARWAAISLKPSALRAVRDAPRSSARSTSSTAPPASISPTRVVDPGRQRLAVHRDPEQRGRAAQVLGPELVRAAVRRPCPICSSSSARTIRLRSFGCTAAAVSGESRPCSAAGPTSASSRSSPARRSRLRRRAQVELGQRGAQVEAGARRPRSACGPRASSCVDLGMRQRREPARAELLLDRHARHQPVLEPVGRPAWPPARRGPRRPRSRRPTRRPGPRRARAAGRRARPRSRSCPPPWGRRWRSSDACDQGLLARERRRGRAGDLDLRPARPAARGP